MAERIERKSKAMAFMLEWYDALRPLPADVRLAVYDAVTAYGLGEDPGELSGVAAAVFTVIRADIDRRRAVSERCRAAGRKGAAVRWARAKAKAEGRGTGDEVQAKAPRPHVTPSQTLHAFLADERRGALERLAASYGVTLERLRRYAELVAAEWEARGTTHRTLDEAFNHMLNTLRKKHAAALDGLPAALPRKAAKPAKTRRRRQPCPLPRPCAALCRRPSAARRHDMGLARPRHHVRRPPRARALALHLRGEENTGHGRTPKNSPHRGSINPSNNGSTRKQVE